MPQTWQLVTVEGNPKPSPTSTNHLQIEEYYTVGKRYISVPVLLISNMNHHAGSPI